MNATESTMESTAVASDCTSGETSSPLRNEAPHDGPAGRRCSRSRYSDTTPSLVILRSPFILAVWSSPLPLLLLSPFPLGGYGIRISLVGQILLTDAEVPEYGLDDIQGCVQLVGFGHGLQFDESLI